MTKILIIEDHDTLRGQLTQLLTYNDYDVTGVADGESGLHAALTEAPDLILCDIMLRGASGPVLSQALRDAGVISERSIPGESLLYRLFDLVGETRPSMMLTRQAARVAKGWRSRQVRDAGTIAADELAGMSAGLRSRLAHFTYDPTDQRRTP